jgi:hypothetical protein
MQKPLQPYKATRHPNTLFHFASAKFGGNQAGSEDPLNSFRRRTALMGAQATQPPAQLRFRARDWVIFAIPAAYFILMALAVWDVIPLRLSVTHSGSANVLSMLDVLRSLPYPARVDRVMTEAGFSQQMIVERISYLTSAYLILLPAYLLGTLIGLLCFVVLGIRHDAITEILMMFSAKTSRVMWPLLFFFLLGDLLVGWFGIHGFGYFPEEHPSRPVDYIITHNSSIVIVLFILSFSLAITLAIVRLTACSLFSMLAVRPTKPIGTQRDALEQRDDSNADADNN